MLYIFDLDGTLVEKFGTQPLTNVCFHLERLESSGHKLAVASNQAGLAWRIWTKAPKFPDVQSLSQRFEQIVQELPSIKHAPWFISVSDNRVKLDSSDYVNLATDLVKACPSLTLKIDFDPRWRKPQPGMLLSALQYYNMNPDQAVFVGDYTTDAEAAAAAGIEFFWADEFFSANRDG